MPCVVKKDLVPKLRELKKRKEHLKQPRTLKQLMRKEREKNLKFPSQIRNSKLLLTCLRSPQTMLFKV